MQEDQASRHAPTAPTGRAAPAEDAGAPPAASAADPAAPPPVRFPVEVEGFQGSLEELVSQAQRGEVDLAGVSVASITGAYRARLAGERPPDAREIADFVSLAARLVSLKAARILPEGAIEVLAPDADAEAAVDDPGARLAEYRLFRAAADALLGEATEQGMRSFLGLVAAEVVPSERLSIPPERLAAAFRRVLERLPEAEPLAVDAVTFSVEGKIEEIRALLARRSRVPFEEVFLRVGSRLEAVACFLALLELVKSGGARVDQGDAFGSITISRGEPEGEAAPAVGAGGPGPPEGPPG